MNPYHIIHTKKKKYKNEAIVLAIRIEKKAELAKADGIQKMANHLDSEAHFFCVRCLNQTYPTTFH